MRVFGKKKVLWMSVRLWMSLFVLACLLFPSSCKLTPERQRAVTKKAEVPGFEEALIAKDRAIASSIAISWKMDPELAQNKLEVEVMNGRAIIRGKVPTEELKKKAETIARNTEGVKDVLNEIEVDPSLKENRILLDDF